MGKNKMGKGMDALFFESVDEIVEKGNINSASGGTSVMRTSEIEPDRKQPRTSFDDDSISELAESLRIHGMLQPILVRPVNGVYKIVAGERRWRAAVRAGLSEVPVVVRELSDVDAAQIALIENLQRESLNPVEEALGYQRLMKEFSMTQEQIATKVSKSRSVVANSLRILTLPQKLIDYVRDGVISVGHAKVLVGIDEEKAVMLADKVNEEKLSVRELEKIVYKPDETPDKLVNNEIHRIKSRNVFCDELELSLSELFSRKVKVISRSGGKAQLRIDFNDIEELKKLAAKLAKHSQ